MQMLIILLLSILIIASVQGQEVDDRDLPYHEMPPAPATFGPGNVVARMIDGLGYRFYWATEGLHPQDLLYRPTPEARSLSETIDHILSLSQRMINAAEGVPNTSASHGTEEVTWQKRRAQVLNTLRKTSQRLADKEEDELAALRIVFRTEKGETELPYWNMINGPIADAIYHTGQIASFRRITGNPMNPKVDVLRGKNRP